MQPRLTISSTVCAALLGLALAGCGSDDPTISTVNETEITASTTASTSTTTEGEEGPPPADVQVSGKSAFSSPTGKVGCLITKRQVHCEISDRYWKTPPGPDDCPPEGDYGPGIQLRAGGAPEFACGRAAVLGLRATELPYGQSIAAGLLRCESEESGITCRDVETGRGFTLSMESYELF